MKRLEEEFKKVGFNFKLERDLGEWRIYRRWSDGGLPPHFELIKPTVSDAQFIDGKFQKGGQLHEVYPSDSQWGVKGFTTMTVDHALNMHGDILEAERLKEERKNEASQLEG